MRDSYGTYGDGKSNAVPDKRLYAILQEMSMASQYAGDPAWRKAAKDFMEKLRPLSDAGCMDLVRDIQKKYRFPQEGGLSGS